MPSDFIAKPPYNVVQPGAYSAVNASLLSQPSILAGHPIPALLGTSLGGQPNKPLYFTSPSQMQQVLRGGVSADACRFLFDGGAQQICFVRVGNTPAQATLNLLNGTSQTVVTLTSLDWGSWNNSILVTVATGPVITLSYTDALGTVYTEKWDLSTIAGVTAAQVAQAINGQLYGYNASNFVSATVGVGALPLSTISNVPLAGGSDGSSPAAGDWTNGLSALESELIDLVVPATGDATIHAQTLTHCQNLSAPNARRERTMICGGLLGETVAYQTGTRIASLRSARAQLVYPGFNDYSSSGVLTAYDPFYLAAKIAGMHCALPDVASSLVHQRVPIVSAETNLSTVQGGAIDQLLLAGVTPVAPAPGSGYWVVDSLSGYNQADATFRDFNKTRSADFVAQYARQSLETQFVGSKQLSSSQNAIQTAANDVMSLLQGMQIIQAFNQAVVAPGPSQGSWNVGLPVMLVGTTKFIFITVSLQSSSTLASSTTTTDLG